MRPPVYPWRELRRCCSFHIQAAALPEPTGSKQSIRSRCMHRFLPGSVQYCTLFPHQRCNSGIVRWQAFAAMLCQPKNGWPFAVNQRLPRWKHGKAAECCTDTWFAPNWSVMIDENGLLKFCVAGAASHRCTHRGLGGAFRSAAG